MNQLPDRPQDRTRAIALSKLEPSARLMLVMIADFMGAAGRCWPSVETLAARTGYCERQARAILADLDQRKIIRRVWGEHLTRDMMIDWDTLATVEPVAHSRGGKRAAKIATTEPAKIAADGVAKIAEMGGKDCMRQAAVFAEMGGKDCPRRDQEAIKEAIKEAPIARESPPAPKPPTGKQMTPDEIAIYAVWKHAHPTADGSPTPDARKALPRILAECGTADRAAVYLMWVAESQDEDALRLRGLAPWPGPDGKLRRRDDLESLSRHIPSRLPMALAWDARGRTEPTAKGSNAVACWQEVTSGRYPTDGPGAAALRTIGGSSAVRGRATFDEARMRDRFVAEYDNANQRAAK